MAAEDYFTPYGEPEDDDDEESDATCKHCGKSGLEWVHTGTRWRLLEGNKFHECSNENVIDDFEVLQ